MADLTDAPKNVFKVRKVTHTNYLDPLDQRVHLEILDSEVRQTLFQALSMDMNYLSTPIYIFAFNLVFYIRV